MKSTILALAIYLELLSKLLLTYYLLSDANIGLAQMLTVTSSSHR